MPLVLSNDALLCSRLPVAGGWLENADSDNRLTVTNPATGEVVAELPACGAGETTRAIETAEQVRPDWSRRPVKERAALLRGWYQSLMNNQEDLARLLTAEEGKPLAESRGEIAYGASYVEWFAEEAKRMDGDVIPGPSSDRRVLTLRQPVGVVGAITPWNFPNAMLARKIAPALAAGCTIVAKPAEETPLSALAMVALAEAAGIPAGAINLVVGDVAAIGSTLTGHWTIRKLTFTGSVAVGKKLLADCAPSMKRTSMELGGNAPFIVFDDADVDAAVEGAIASKFRNAGQTCVCANRILVQEGAFETFRERLIERVQTLRLGDGLDEATTLGPLIDAQAAQKVLDTLHDATRRGAEVELGGRRGRQGDAFVEPTVLSGVTEQMTVFQEEIFGPVVPLVRFRSEAEAIRMANDTPYGLCAYFYTSDVTRSWRVGEALEYGIVGVNTGLISNEMAPFGGIKESGHGREGSKYGLDDYTDLKYVCVGGLQ